MSSAEKNKALIKAWAMEEGFESCGISKAEFLEEEAPRLEKWLNQNYHGKMAYMENHFDKRLDPQLLVPGAKSVVSLWFNYYPENAQPEDSYQIARYAFGRDYHKVLKKKLKRVFLKIQEEIGEVNGRIFVDSAPVLEKAWAERSGIGWRGKNTNLIGKKQGSYFFLAELILDLELTPDAPATDHCGSCTACIDACPTQALTPYFIDASKCISYLTIELKDQIPEQFSNQTEDWIFGCDICQEVCPWNRFSKPKNDPELKNKNPEFLEWKYQDWHELTQEIFEEAFAGSAVKRTKYEGLMRNIYFNKQ